MANMRGEEGKPGRRSLTFASAIKKLDAILRVQAGESKASAVWDMGVPESTLRGWCKAEYKIRNMARNTNISVSAGKRSPASSFGTNPRAANLSSKEEGRSNAKKRKLKGRDTFKNGDSNETKIHDATITGLRQ